MISFFPPILHNISIINLRNNSYLHTANVNKTNDIIYAVNWCVSRWNGRDTMDVINFFISRPGGLTHEKV